jgi:hypothetical protein
LRKLAGLMVLLVSILVPTAASAGNADDTVGPYLSASIGYQNPRGKDYNNDLDPGEGLLLSAGWRVHPMLAIEASLFGATSNDHGNTATIDTLGLDARWFPIPGGFMEPNFLAGYAPIAGVTEDDGTFTSTLTGYSSQIGGGMRFNVVRHLVITGDVRYSFIRYVKGEIKDDATSNSLSGKLDHQFHGDDLAILGGATLQF